MAIFPVYFCPVCARHQALSAGCPVPVACPGCQARAARPEESLFDRGEWGRSDRPEAMLVCLRELGVAVSSRKRRLLRCAQTRVNYADCHDPRYRDALACAEEWADAGAEPPAAEELRRDLRSVRWEQGPSNFWVAAADACLSDRGDRINGAWWAPSDVIPTAARAVREVFANPFAPLTWHPDWFTSTVRALATHIYAAREFTTMPILADALQDAGCEDEQILTHCRAERPHTRGCWVLDAILGKS